MRPSAMTCRTWQLPSYDCIIKMLVRFSYDRKLSFWATRLQDRCSVIWLMSLIWGIIFLSSQNVCCRIVLPATSSIQSNELPGSYHIAVFIVWIHFKAKKIKWIRLFFSEYDHKLQNNWNSAWTIFFKMVFCFCLSSFVGREKVL